MPLGGSGELTENSPKAHEKNKKQKTALEPKIHPTLRKKPSKKRSLNRKLTKNITNQKTKQKRQKTNTVPKLKSHPQLSKKTCP